MESNSTAGELPRSVTTSATPPISRSQSAPSIVLSSPSSSTCLSQLLKPSSCFILQSLYFQLVAAIFQPFKTLRMFQSLHFFSPRGSLPTYDPHQSALASLIPPHV